MKFIYGVGSFRDKLNEAFDNVESGKEVWVKRGDIYFSVKIEREAVKKQIEPITESF